MLLKLDNNLVVEIGAIYRSADYIVFQSNIEAYTTMVQTSSEPHATQVLDTIFKKLKTTALLDIQDIRVSVGDDCYDFERMNKIVMDCIPAGMSTQK